MTREEAKELVPIIQAFIEGKIIQYKNDRGVWVETDCPVWAKHTEYRIKPESKYRPFQSQEECWQEMLKHQPFGWIKGKVLNTITFITEISTCSTTYSELCFGLPISTSIYDANFLLNSYTFVDGTPFGIKED